MQGPQGLQSTLTSPTESERAADSHQKGHRCPEQQGKRRCVVHSLAVRLQGRAFPPRLTRLAIDGGGGKVTSWEFCEGGEKPSGQTSSERPWHRGVSRGSDGTHGDVGGVPSAS